MAVMPRFMKGMNEEEKIKYSKVFSKKPETLETDESLCGDSVCGFCEECGGERKRKRW